MVLIASNHHHIVLFRLLSCLSTKRETTGDDKLKKFDKKNGKFCGTTAKDKQLQLEAVLRFCFFKWESSG